MKRSPLLLPLCLAGAALVVPTMTVGAQTLHVVTGSVTYDIPAAQAGDMTYDGGTTLTILGRAIPTSAITRMYTDHADVVDGTVRIAYDGASAQVSVAGNIMRFVEATVSGAHVSIAQSDALDDTTGEITYTLSGSSTAGSFLLSGSYKSSIVLNGVSLTSTSGAAFDVQNGKRISISLADGTTNVFADAASGTQKACFNVKGHVEFKDAGTLTLTGNANHAYKSGEYTELKKSTGKIQILSAVADGMHVGQYLEMKGGTLSVSGAGDDGIQVEANAEGDELDGQAILSGGSLTISSAAAGGKGLKCDSLLTLSGTTVSITTTGNATYDATEGEYKASSALSSAADILITGGTLTLQTSGTGSKALKSDGQLSIAGGSVTATVTGAGYYDSSALEAKGSAAISTGGNLSISGGTVSLSNSGKGGKGIKCDGALNVVDGSLTAVTTGTAYVYSSSYTTSAKAIRADGAISISGGSVTASATGSTVSSGRESSAPEGIESKKTIDISGGIVMATSTDDAINSASHLTISGGYVYARATGNDGIDANGNCYIKGGVVYAAGASSPEVAIDANTEGGYKLYITGGTVVAFGGVESNASVSQGYVSGSWTANSNYALTSGSTPLAVFKAPASGGTGLFLSLASLASGSSYTLKSGVTVSGGTPFFGGYYTEGATVSGGTSTTLTAATGTYSGGGGGGWPGGGGGRW